jgi:hypothetical protein
MPTSNHRFRPASPLVRLLFAALALASATVRAEPPAGGEAKSCGELVTLRTHADSTTRYALAKPRDPPGAGSTPVALVLLVGGAGYPNLNDSGCARLLKGNSLVRSIALFRGEGFFTVLVDAPSDWQGDDGLAEFRINKKHAEDLGKVIADVRSRTRAAVWLVGTSRGGISAANGASRLTGAEAPDGVVLTSPVMSGQSGARKAFASQSVFDLPLESIHMPILVVGHVEDACARSPAGRIGEIIARTESAREQAVAVTGGPGGAGLSSLAACEGRSPHGFIGQEADVAKGIARFVRGGTY